MSVFFKQFKARQLFHTYKVLTAAQARQGHYYFPDFTPGPYPVTKEEREAAAKKYNLLPEEYEPFAEDEMPVGDYPKLPFESVDSKDPYHPWDNPELRKDFNEPVPREIMMLLPEGISTVPKELSIAQRLLIFISLSSAAFLFVYVLYKIERVLPVTEKQYPAPNVTHYTFDRLSDEEMEKRKAEEAYKKCMESCEIRKSAKTLNN